MSALYRFTLLAALFFVSLTITACASSDASTCSVDADCDGEERCIDGGCEVPPENYCTGDIECPLGYYCDDDTDRCTEVETNGSNQTNQNNQNNDENTNNLTNNDPQNQTNQNQQPDPDAPTVANISPAEGSMNVDVDTTIRVTFDQPMNTQFGIFQGGISLWTPDQEQVEVDVEYLDDENEVVLTPSEPLFEAMRYTISIDAGSLWGANGLQLVEGTQTYFVTQWESDADHAVLAELFAPIIYQETANTNVPDVFVDIPTRLDFAGNLDVSGNKNASQQTNAVVPAHVYYSVITTESHYFIQYVLYYTARRSSIGTLREHDLTGIVVVVDRDTLEVKIVDAVHTDDTPRRDDRAAYIPDSSDVQARTDNWANSTHDFDADDLVAGAHFPLFIPSGQHVSCFWHDREDLGWTVRSCPGDAGQFPSGQGIVLRAGDSAQTFDDAQVGDSGYPEMTYELLPFIDPMWMHIGDQSCGLFGGLRFTYDPGSEAVDALRPTGRGDVPLFLPRALCTSDDPSYGNLPYAWLRSTDINSGGTWFLDPAYFLNVRYDFQGALSLDYCDNFYFGIDRSEESECSDD